MFRILSAIFVLLVLVTPAFADREYLKIDAQQLSQEYIDSSFEADKKYKGTFLEISGVIEEIKDGVLGITIMTLVGADESMKIRISFTKFDPTVMEQLSKGSSVTVRGIGESSDAILGAVLIGLPEIVE